MTDQLVKHDRATEIDRPSQILEGTCRVIAQSGAEGLRMAAVAREAGVSNALLHYYFSTRDELIRQAFEYHDRRETIRSAQRGAQITDPIERIRDVLVHELSDDAAVREGWLLWHEMQSLAMFNEDFRETIAGRARRWVEYVAGLIDEAQRFGVIGASVDNNAAALRLTAIVDGLGGHVEIGSVTRDQALRTIDQALALEFANAERGPA